MKKGARIILLVLAVLFGLLAALAAFGPLTHKTQNAKNQIVLADMKDRVQAVREFQRQNARLPSKDELTVLSRALPVRYFRYDYEIDIKPGGDDRDYPKNWPAAGGWVLSFWRGEWREYYSSWDDRYTLSQQLTAWDSYGIPFVAALGLALLSRARFLRDGKKPEPNQSSVPTIGLAPGRGSP